MIDIRQYFLLIFKERQVLDLEFLSIRMIFNMRINNKSA